MCKRILSLLVVSLVMLGIGGCKAPDVDSNEINNQKSKLETVKVVKKPISPILSFSSTVQKAETFTINASENGSFNSDVKVGDILKPNTTVGTLSSKQLKTSVTAEVVDVAKSGLTYPKHFPLVTLSYPGYAFKVEIPASFDYLADETELTAKFQADGKSPEMIDAIYLSYESDKNSDTHSSQLSALLIIPQDIDLHIGERALVVLRGNTRNAALQLPLSCLAGREKKAFVSVQNSDGTFKEQKVSLGVSDGSMVEILDGLKEGDTVLAYPPNIDPRVK